MGMSASQARFLQLTARRSNLEYEAQQICQQRLQLASKLEMYSNEYQAKISNRKMIFRYNNGTGYQNVDVTYQNYKNIMNQQQEGLSTTQQRLFLVSSSGNKIVVANEEEMQKMIDSIKVYKDEKDDEGNVTSKEVHNGLSKEDFLIVDNLEDPDAFQLAIQNGDYYFATMNETEFDEETGEAKISFAKDSWETIGGGVIQEEYDKADDAEAEAKFTNQQAKIQKTDKQLEMRLDQLETERNAIQTEIDSVKKVISDNVEKTFKTFSS